MRTQEKLLLRWFRDDAGLTLRRLAAEAGIVISTAYRYLHVLDRGRQHRSSHVNLDGTLIATFLIAHHDGLQPTQQEAV